MGGATDAGVADIASGATSVGGAGTPEELDALGCMALAILKG